MRNDHEGALEAYQKALKLNPSNVEARRDLGDSLRDLGRFEQALLEYREAKQQGGDSLSLDLRIAKCLAESDTESEREANLSEAHKLLVKLADENPENPEVLNTLAIVLWKMNHLPEAAFVLEKTLKLDPGYYRARNNLGIVLFKLKRYDQAVNVWRQAIQLKRDYPCAHFNLGCALLQAGLASQAASAFQESLKYEPVNAAARNNLGLAYVKLGDPQKAIEEWRQAIRIDPNLAAAFINLGKTLQGEAIGTEPGKAGDSSRSIGVKPDS